jgi:hypothetical protein
MTAYANLGISNVCRGAKVEPSPMATIIIASQGDGNPFTLSVTLSCPNDQAFCDYRELPDRLSLTPPSVLEREFDAERGTWLKSNKTEYCGTSS